MFMSCICTNNSAKASLLCFQWIRIVKKPGSASFLYSWSEPIFGLIRPFSLNPFPPCILPSHKHFPHQAFKTEGKRSTYIKFHIKEKRSKRGCNRLCVCYLGLWCFAYNPLKQLQREVLKLLQNIDTFIQSLLVLRLHWINMKLILTEVLITSHIHFISRLMTANGMFCSIHHLYQSLEHHFLNNFSYSSEHIYRN